jgi:cytochrome b
MTRPDASTIGAGAGATVPVWDRTVRAVHWGLALGVGVCAVTGLLGPKNTLDLHLAAGAAMAALLALRAVWGFYGSPYARFSTWHSSPAALLAHLRAIAAGRRDGHLGHNPPGVAMAVAMLGVLLLLALTGLVALGGADKQGPLAFAVDFRLGEAARRAHAALAWLVLALLAGHIAGVIFESRRLRENLARAMLTGRKRARPEARPPGEAQPRRAAAILALAGLLALASIAGLSRLPARGVPDATLDRVYTLECGSCHMAYPPSLLPARSWQAILASLPDHFGEDASLGAATAGRLASYLAAHSAGHADTRAANLFRVVNVAAPLRMTATPAWRRLHGDVPDSVFGRRAIGTRGACAACHRDAATGRFDPQAIAVPQEITP